MKIIGTFDIYFLILILIQSIIVICIDSRYFKEKSLHKQSLSAKWIGGIYAVGAIALYTIGKFMA